VDMAPRQPSESTRDRLAESTRDRLVTLRSRRDPLTKRPSLFHRGCATRHAHGMLGGVAAVATICALLVAFALRRVAPAASLGLLGAIPGGVAGFFVGASDGPAFAPAAAIVGATIGLFLLGLVGIVVTDSRAPRSARRRSALAVLIGGILTAGVLPHLLITACPLYVTAGADPEAHDRLDDRD